MFALGWLYMPRGIDAFGGAPFGHVGGWERLGAPAGGVTSVPMRRSMYGSFSQPLSIRGLPCVHVPDRKMVTFRLLMLLRACDGQVRGAWIFDRRHDAGGVR